MRIRLLSDWFFQRLIIAFRFPKRECRLGKVSKYLATGLRYILKEKANISSIEPQNTDDQTLLSFSDVGENWSQFSYIIKDIKNPPSFASNYKIYSLN